MELDKVHRVHILGVGGIGTSALARYFLHEGKKVSGYDRTPSSMTKALIEEGVELHYEDDPERIPRGFLEEPETALLLRSLAIGEANQELSYLKGKGFPVHSRAEVLGTIARKYSCIAVAGTHGKTTTSCLLAQLLKDSGIPCHALLGGISADLGSNVQLEGKASYLVVEADEYGRSFLELEPERAVVTAMESDHLDVYGDDEGLREAFFEFQGKVPPDGKLFLEEKVPLAPGLQRELTRFGAGEANEVQVRNVRPEEGEYRFDLSMKGREWKGLVAKMPGFHNVLDLSAAIAVAHELGVEEAELREALKRIKGVKRRFEYRLEREGRVLIDDYAHHPTELLAVIRTVRELYPERRITGIFQPHLYSRTRDHATAFGEALSELDALLLLPIYPAREAPIPGVNAELLAERVSIEAKEVVEKEALPRAVEKLDPELLLVLGAGDISEEVEGLAELMSEMAEKEKGKEGGS